MRLREVEGVGPVNVVSPDQLDLEDVRAQLSLPAETVSWLGAIGRPAGAPGPVLPSAAEAERLLERLGVDSDDRAETLAARPDPREGPAFWWVLDRAYHKLLATMGVPVPMEGFPGWPGLPAETGAMGRHLPVWTYLAVLPEVRRYHADRRIGDEISWESLATLGDLMRVHRSATGLGGVGLFGFGWTAVLRFRGADYQLGKLGFNRGIISLSNGPCGHALSVHITRGPPLDPAACDRSFDLAREFFPRHFPEEPVTFFTCSSWLMDPQLAEYLPESSNLVRFQRRFNLVPARPEQPPGDERIEEYVFGQPYESLDDYPQDTTLRRAYVTHRRAGRHWYPRTGWMPF